MRCWCVGGQHRQARQYVCADLRYSVHPTGPAYRRTRVMASASTGERCDCGGGLSTRRLPAEPSGSFSLPRRAPSAQTLEIWQKADVRAASLWALRVALERSRLFTNSACFAGCTVTSCHRSPTPPVSRPCASTSTARCASMRVSTSSPRSWAQERRSQLSQLRRAPPQTPIPNCHPPAPSKSQSTPVCRRWAGPCPLRWPSTSAWRSSIPQVKSSLSSSLRGRRGSLQVSPSSCRRSRRATALRTPHLSSCIFTTSRDGIRVVIVTAQSATMAEAAGPTSHVRSGPLARASAAGQGQGGVPRQRRLHTDDLPGGCAPRPAKGPRFRQHDSV